MAQFSSTKVRFLPLIMTSALFISISVPFLIAVIRRKVLTFLPFVSHAAAFPPQSAIYSIFMIVGAFFGIATFILRFAAIEHRRHRLDARKLLILNRLSLGIGAFACFSVVFASHFPVGFVTHDKYDWILTVIVPHFLGSAFIVTAFTLYILLHAFLTYAQRKKSSMNVAVHSTLAMCVVVTNWTTCLPFYAAMRDIIPKVIDDETGEINLETDEYSFYYIISSLSGWGFFFLVLMFIATFYKDFKKMKITFTLIPKQVKIDTVEPGPHAYSGGEEITKM